MLNFDVENKKVSNSSIKLSNTIAVQSSNKLINIVKINSSYRKDSIFCFS